MSFGISWTDIPEKFDDTKEIEKNCIDPNLPSAEILENSIFIEGDNYPVLQLMQKSYSNKINLIYIDPPYNTGNTFTYSDDFSLGEDTHSAWLSFMNRRLKLARDLLKNDGCIFIAIDQSELYTLKLLCDQIFGEDNFVNDFMWLHGKGKKDTWSRTLQQHTLCYAKNKKDLQSFEEIEYTNWATKNADNDSRGNWFSGSISFTENRSNPKHRNYYSISSPTGIIWTRQWMKSREEMEKLIEENKIYFGPAPDYSSVPRIKVFNGEAESVIPRNIIDCVDSTRQSQKHLDELLGEKGIFDNPKPVDLISHLIEITKMDKNALIMDFFAGSGTTFEAVAELNKKDGGNRKCILVQKPEIINQLKKKSSNFNTISQICKTRITKVAEKNDLKIDCFSLITKF